MYTVRAQPVSPGARRGRPHPVSIVTSGLSIELMKARAHAFNLYRKIKSRQRYISDPHFHQYRVLLQGQAEEVVAASHALDEQIRQLRGNDTCALELGINVQSSNDADVEYVSPEDLLVQLRLDNQILVGSLRSAQALCQESGDIVTESLIDVWIDEARRRAAVLMEVTWGD